MKSQTVTIRLPADIAEWIDRQAEQQKFPTGKTAVIVTVLRQAIEAEAKVNA